MPPPASQFDAPIFSSSGSVPLADKPAVHRGRRFLSFFLLLTLLLTMPSARAIAQEATPVPSEETSAENAAAQATLTGRLVQGTADAPPPSEQPLTLTALVDFQPVESLELTTDANGEFRVDGLSTDPARTYLVETIYGGVPYRSQPVTPSSGALPAVELIVYEPTNDASGLYISRLQWVIDYAPGEVIVGQIVTFGNRLDRAYVGQTVEGVPRPATTALALPTGAQELSFQGGILGGRYTRVDDLVYDVAAVPPGEETQQTFMGFNVPYEGNAVRIEQPFLYEIAEANLLVAELPKASAVQLDVLTPDVENALSFSDTQEIQGSTFALWTGTDLTPQTIVLDFNGLIPTGGSDSRGQREPQPALDTLRAPQAVPWALGGGLAVALLGILAWGLRRPAGQSRSPQQTLAAERDALVQRIAQLDDQHAIGTVADERWAHERARLKSRLLEVAGQLEQVRDQVRDEVAREQAAD